MKLKNKLSFLPLLFVGFAANAQTETIGETPKNLQQLYLSIGTGPALTTNSHSNALGGSVMVNFTGAFGNSNIYRLNIQHSGFTHKYDPEPGLFDYLTATSYDTEFYSVNENSVISLLYGKRYELNRFVQFQGLAGLGTNFIQTFGIENMEIIEGVRCGTTYTRNYIHPGVTLQAEAMLLPTRFAGLTLGAYANLTPKIPTAGMNLSLNLVKLK